MRIKKDEFNALMSIRENTQSDIGRKLGVSHQQISAWINGDRNPKISSVRKLAAALGCKIADIADFENKIEELALKGEKLSQVVAEQTDTDYLKNRINEIYDELDRASRAELLAYAERLAVKNITTQPKTPVIETTPKIEAEQVLNCPKCNQEIPVPEGTETLFCVHCGQKIRLKD